MAARSPILNYLTPIRLAIVLELNYISKKSLIKDYIPAVLYKILLRLNINGIHQVLLSKLSKKEMF